MPGRPRLKKSHTRAIRRLYCVRDIDRGYRLEMARRDKKQKFEAKSKITRTLNEKTPINKYNKVKKDREMFGYKIYNNNREALLL